MQMKSLKHIFGKVLWLVFWVMLFFFYNCTLDSGVHVQIMQDCCIGTHMTLWFAASIPPSPISGISPHVIPPQPPYPPLSLSYSPPNRPHCVMFPSLCPCVLIVQHLPMSENMWCLIFCSCVSLLRMMVSRFIPVPRKDRNAWVFLWLHSIPWCVCATFSLSSLSLMGIWVGTRSLLL